MAARAYSAYSIRKSTAPGKAKGKAKKKDTGTKMSDATPFRCPNWGDQLDNVSNVGWGQDTEKVAQHPKAKGVANRSY